MKFIRYEGKRGTDLGVMTRDESGVVSLRDVLPNKAFADMTRMIEEIRGDELTLLQLVPDGYDKYPVEKLENVRVLAPIEKPVHGQPTDAVCRCLKSFSQMTAAMTVSTV